MSAQPIPHFGPSPRRATGVLDAWVQQPTDSSPAANAQRATYTEQWKGPYDVGKDVLTHISPGDKITKFHNWLGSNRVYRISPATPPDYEDSEGNTHQMVWKVESINVVEQKAGDHCVIRVVFYGSRDDEGEEESELIEGSEEWNLDWQPYTVSPYEFCSNDGRAPTPLSPSNQHQPDWGASACRDNIEQYRLWAGKAVEVDAGGQTGIAYAWSPNPKQTYAAYPARYVLSECEAEVWKKVQLGRNCIWHYPVLTYTSKWRGGPTFEPPDDDDVGAGMDEKLPNGNIPDGCPFEFASFSVGGEDKEWVWVRNGDRIMQQQDPAYPDDDEKKIYTRIKTWIGVDDVDDNFYGYDTFNHGNAQGVTKGRWYKQCL